MIFLCEDGYYKANYDRYLNFDENTLKELNEYLKENSIPENYTELTENDLIDIMVNRHDRDFYYVDEPDFRRSMYNTIEDWAFDVVCSMPERIYDSTHDYCSLSWGINK